MNSKSLRTAQCFLRNEFACVGRHVHFLSTVSKGGDENVA